MYMSGTVRNVCGTESLLYKLTAIILNFNMWEYRSKKRVPGYATIKDDFFYLFNNIVSNKGALALYATNSNNLLCRSWRERYHGRG